MRVLLDTCVLSEVLKKDCNENVRKFIDSIQDEKIYISVISIGEINKGIHLLEESRRKRDLQSWLQALEFSFSDRILPVDLETVYVWGEITAKAKRAGRVVASSDGLIAATALRHGLHLMTRNASDFEPTGCMLLNPWKT